MLTIYKSSGHIKQSGAFCFTFVPTQNNMIRKAFNIIAIFLLLLATGGIPITRHYCGSTAISFSVYTIPTSSCDRNCNKCHDGYSNNHKGCDKCHNVFKFPKVTDDFDGEYFITTTQSLTDDVTLYSSSVFSIPTNVHNVPLTILINQRANNYHEVRSPALLCIFLC